MITDQRHPNRPKTDRSNEVWIEVDARRAARAYAKGAMEIKAALPDIAAAAFALHGETPDCNLPGGSITYRKDTPVRNAKWIIQQSTLMAQAMVAGVGVARMPLSEVRVWLNIESGQQLRWLMGENSTWPGDVPDELK